MKNRRLYQLASLARAENQFSARTQMMAVAITATEMQFRPLLHRLVEYCYVSFLLILGRDAGAVTVGISQISIRHYVSLEKITQFQSLILSMSAGENLIVCCKLVQAANSEVLDDVAKAYNGNSTQFYRAALRRNYAILCEIGALRGN